MKNRMMKPTYEAPEASVDLIEMERDFLQGTTITGTQLQDMNENGIYDDDF